MADDILAVAANGLDLKVAMAQALMQFLPAFESAVRAYAEVGRSSGSTLSLAVAVLERTIPSLENARRQAQHWDLWERDAKEAWLSGVARNLERIGIATLAGAMIAGSDAGAMRLIRDGKVTEADIEAAAAQNRRALGIPE